MKRNVMIGRVKGRIDLKLSQLGLWSLFMQPGSYPWRSGSHPGHNMHLKGYLTRGTQRNALPKAWLSVFNYWL